jgi:hypothetical protein
MKTCMPPRVSTGQFLRKPTFRVRCLYRYLVLDTTLCSDKWGNPGKSHSEGERERDGGRGERGGEGGRERERERASEGLRGYRVETKGAKRAGGKRARREEREQRQSQFFDKSSLNEATGQPVGL